jgi:hypothetical protein
MPFMIETRSHGESRVIDPTARTASSNRPSKRRRAKQYRTTDAGRALLRGGS